MDAPRVNQQTQKQKRRINGVLLLDKPIGKTSNAILQEVKKLFNAKKAGHTGSLDPLASGMLPICFGEATKFSQFLLEADKSYFVSAKLGVRTTTSDSEGEVVSQRTVPELSISDLEKQLATFLGEISQIPSMYSAIKHEGQPLYKLARQGITVERKSRQITIYDIKVLEYRNETVHFNITCSKGTYVRTIVDDFGELLGCGAHVTQLRRLHVGPYPYENMVTMASLQKTLASHEITALDQYLLPIDSALLQYPKVEITSSMAFYFRQGQALMVGRAPRSGLLRMYDKDGDFLGVGEVLENGKVAPRRLVV